MRDDDLSGKKTLPSWWMAGLAAGVLLTGLPARAGAATAPARSAAMAISLPLKYDGAYQGDITAQVTPDGSVALDAERFITLLGPRVSPENAVKLRAAAGVTGAAGAVTLDTFAALGIAVAYDPATLEIAVNVPVSRQGAQSIQAQDNSARQRPQPTMLPSPFSLTATLRSQQRYQWATGSSRASLEPVETAADIAGNFGGVGGLDLFAQLGFRGGRADRGGGLDRGNVLLVHDDIRHAIRFSAGDIAPQPAGFQTAPLIGGVSIERQFGTIQPFRNIRPSGRFAFQLDKASTVDLVVNGTVIRTLRLDPGQYNLADFPFFNGLNQVELYVVDGAGRRLLTSFSQYFSARLLERGIFEFGGTAGVLEQAAGGRRGLASVGNASRYLTKEPAFSGFARYGLASNLTAGINLQGGRDRYMGGIEGALATPIGTFGGLASFSHHPLLGRGTALLASYEGSAQRLGPLQRPQLNLEVQALSRAFSPLALIVPINRYRLTAQGRFAAQIFAGISVGTSVARFIGRGGEPDQLRTAVSLGRRIGPINVTAAWEKIASRGPERQQHGLLTLTMPLGHTASVRASFDTRSNLASFEYSRFQPDEIDTFGLRAALIRGDDGFSGAGELSYNNNRFAAVLSHSLIAESNLSRVRAQQSSLSFATQLAFAGGSVAVGRPVGSRFAIVSAHETLEDASVTIRQGAGRAHPQARTGVLGPALAPAGNAYSAGELRLDVDRLPPGYDIGNSQYTLVPGPAAGYHIIVGSDASRMLLGTALDAAGAPLSLQGGTLTLIGDPKAQPVLVFTNRAGRFAGNGLKPGTYEMVLGADRQYRTRVAISAKARGVVDVGSITLTEEKR